MSLSSLDAPLRLTWDLCPADQVALNSEQLLQVGERLVEAGIFYLLLDKRPLLHPGLNALLKCLTAGGCQVSLVLGQSAAEWQGLAALETDVDLFIDAAPWLVVPDGLQRLAAAFDRLAGQGRNASLLWVPGAGQLQNLRPLLELCIAKNVPRFKLPNPGIGVNSEPSAAAELLQAADLAQLTSSLDLEPLETGEMSLEVHDLFLWELIFPQGGGERSEYGGCQAANSLGHVAVNADLWPCSSWPQPLGNLLQQELLDIWDSAARHQVRTEVAIVPVGCVECTDYPICYGGCRGLSRSYPFDPAGRDLLCSEPRKKENC